MRENPNNLYADISYASLSHAGEEICGDHVEMVKPDDNSTVVVLADGLGSGVKAGILSTLTSKIISTLLAESQARCPSVLSAESATLRLPSSGSFRMSMRRSSSMMTPKFCL